MSRYAVNKVLREVILSDEARDRYLADPVAYIDGRDMTKTEREAILTSNYAEMYDAGVHPFLLNCFASRFWPLNEFFPRQIAYSRALHDHGHPDFST